jgi:hypothetical protein
VGVVEADKVIYDEVFGREGPDFPPERTEVRREEASCATSSFVTTSSPSISSDRIPDERFCSFVRIRGFRSA